MVILRVDQLQTEVYRASKQKYNDSLGATVHEQLDEEIVLPSSL
jgi:hypothetical protein